ncbi:unnamed protein product [Closterium sp. NIES-54]
MRRSASPRPLGPLAPRPIGPPFVVCPSNPRPLGPAPRPLGPYAPGPRPLGLSATAATATAATATAFTATTAPACCTAMASLRVLAFDHEGRPVQFDTWLDDLQLYQLSDSKDSVSLFDLASSAAPAPPATADNATRLLTTAVTDPSFESAAASALVAELLDFAAACRLDYAIALVAESASASPPCVGGECALGADVLEDMQEDFECLAAAVPRFASMLLAPEGDPDAPDIPTPRSYVEAITGPYSSQWQVAMDAEMASWNSTGTYVDEVPPRGANIVDGMWIFRVKRPPGSLHAFKARYVARGFSQRQGVDYFQTFSPTPKMTTLWVLLHVAAQRDYELHSLDFSTTFLQGSLHEEILLRRPPGFIESFPAGTQWSLRRPVYGLRQAPRKWHDTLRTTLAALGFAPAAADPSLFLRTDTSLPPFYVLAYVDDLVFATADIEALTLVKSELQKRHTCTDLGELCSYLGLQITQDRARRTITLTQSHMVHQVFQHFGFQFSSPQPTPLSTTHSLSAPPSDESVEQSGPYPELVGCVIYLMTCTRPDLAYPLTLLARYVAPGRHRKRAALRAHCSFWPTSALRAAACAVFRVAPLARSCCPAPPAIVLPCPARNRAAYCLAHCPPVSALPARKHHCAPARERHCAPAHERCPPAACTRPAPCPAAAAAAAAKRAAAAAAAAKRAAATAAAVCVAAAAKHCCYCCCYTRYCSCALPCQAPTRQRCCCCALLPNALLPPVLLLPALLLLPELLLPAALLLPPACAPPCPAAAGATAATAATAVVTALAPASRGGQQQPLPHPDTLSQQHLREWVIQRGRPGGGGYRAGGAGQQWQAAHPDTLSPQQILDWIVQQGRPGGGGYGFMGIGQRRQQRQHEIFSPQRLRDCVFQQGVSGCVEAAALGASESTAALGASESAAALGGTASTATGPASAEALHTLTLDSGASRCFFRDFTTVTPLAAPVPVSVADPTGGPVVARASTVLQCPAVPSGSLSGLHLPLFSTNLVSNAVLQDVWVDTFILGGHRVAICTCSLTGRHIATFTRRPGSSPYTLPTASAQVPASGQEAASSQVSASGQVAASLPPLPRSPAPPCLPCVEGRQRVAPHSLFPPSTAPLQTLHMDEWGPAPVHGTDQERYFLCASGFGGTFQPYLCTMTGFGEFSSGLLAEFCRAEGIVQTFTLPASPQQNGIAGTSMFHAAAPHFLWPFAVRYAAHQLNL